MLLFLIDICRAIWRGYTAAKYWLALKITAGVSTMECAFVFLALAIYGFPGWNATPAQYVQWISQTLIQLVMLSILAVQQKITQTQQKQHHHELKSVHADHAAEIASLHAKLDRLTPIPPPVSPSPGPGVTRDPRARPKDPKTGRFVKRNAAPQEAA